MPLDEMLQFGVRGQPDVGALASRDAKRATVMLWHYHDDDIAGPAAAVEFSLRGLPAHAATARVTHYRIDETHSNAFAEWQRMGSPIAPDAAQYATMKQSSELATLTATPNTVTIAEGAATLRFALPRQAVSLIVLEWD